MIYVHQNNIQTKISAPPNGYNGKRAELSSFYSDKYLEFRKKIDKISFSKNNPSSFKKAAQLFNDYLNTLHDFSIKNGIKSQSKFESTFLEEISVYLFKSLPLVSNGTFDFFNKGIFSGLKIDTNNNVAIITKDVDFCIGRKVTVAIDNRKNQQLILPIVSVEVKTYLDATMFGEIKSSSKALRSASPESKAYVLMGYKDLADEHIIAARQDSTLNEMFALKKDNSSPIESDTLYEYWCEISNAVANAYAPAKVPQFGRLLRIV